MYRHVTHSSKSPFTPPTVSLRDGNSAMKTSSVAFLTDHSIRTPNILYFPPKPKRTAIPVQQKQKYTNQSNQSKKKTSNPTVSTTYNYNFHFSQNPCVFSQKIHQGAFPPPSPHCGRYPFGRWPPKTWPSWHPSAVALWVHHPSPGSQQRSGAPGDPRATDGFGRDLM